ncbi:hypothetical protein T492DRAFT_846899 [Pavlovales sp. CCMP2436]|nr:hypothetical protein T492DRAFT_846899 [Pavlovales sp. CCMP2436]
MHANGEQISDEGDLVDDSTALPPAGSKGRGGKGGRGVGRGMGSRGGGVRGRGKGKGVNGGDEFSPAVFGLGHGGPGSNFGSFLGDEDVEMGDGGDLGLLEDNHAQNGLPLISGGVSSANIFDSVLGLDGPLGGERGRRGAQGVLGGKHPKPGRGGGRGGKVARGGAAQWGGNEDTTSPLGSHSHSQSQRVDKELSQKQIDDQNDPSRRRVTNPVNTNNNNNTIYDPELSVAALAGLATADLGPPPAGHSYAGAKRKRQSKPPPGPFSGTIPNSNYNAAGVDSGDVLMPELAGAGAGFLAGAGAGLELSEMLSDVVDFSAALGGDGFAD